MWKEDITFEESLRNILPAIARKVEERMPETGTFKRFGYRFDVDASYFDEGGVWFDYDSAKLPEGRIVILSARFPGNSRKMTEYIFWGTKSEIAAYFRDPARISEFMQEFREMDERIRLHD